MRKPIAAALLAVASLAAQAAPFAITATGTIDQSTFAEIRDGERYAVTYVFDNGGTSAQSQTWLPTDLVCVIWRMNNAADVVYRQTSFAGAIFWTGPTTTDASGALTGVYASINNFGSAGDTYTVSGMALSGTPYWSAYGPDDASNGLRDGSRMFGQFNGIPRGNRWSNPVAVASACDTPPLPPGPPTHLAATPGNGQVAVNWQAPAASAGSSAPVRYTATARLQDGTVARSCTANHPATACTVTGLANGIGVHLSVIAEDASGALSPPSRSIYAIPSAAPPPPGPGGVQPVPTLSQWGVLLLAALMLLAGLRRRAHHS